MAPVSYESTVELALSIVSSTFVRNSKDLCRLLAVSKGLQAAIISPGGSSREFLLRFHCHGNLARACDFASWMQKYHMLVKQLILSGPYEGISDDVRAALVLGLRPPLQLASLTISGFYPLPYLQQVDAQQLIDLSIDFDSSYPDGSVQPLVTELGRFSKLQDLHWEDLAVASTTREQLSFSSLAQLTALKRLTVWDKHALPRVWQHTPSQLQYLDCVDLDDVALSNMHHLRQLKGLTLLFQCVTGTALAAAAKCWTQLQALEVFTHPSSEIAEQLISAVSAMTSLQQLQLHHLPNITQQDIASIAQASRLTRLELSFDAPGPPVPLHLSPWTALQQLHNLQMRNDDINFPTVALTTFGFTLTRLPLLRCLKLGVALHQQALAQVLCCTQLTGLHLHCADCPAVIAEDEESLPFIEPADALYLIPSYFQLNIIALHMKQLQELTIMACQQDELLAILDGPLLPNLNQLRLYPGQPQAQFASEESVMALLDAIQQVRPALHVRFGSKLQ
jgi:hypothetical protein